MKRKRCEVGNCPQCSRSCSLSPICVFVYRLNHQLLDLHSGISSSSLPISEDSTADFLHPFGHIDSKSTVVHVDGNIHSVHQRVENTTGA